MKKNQRCFTARASVVAVRGALIAMTAMPVAYAADAASEDPAVAELTQPTNTVEIGVRDVSSGSFKAGEYSGLEKKGATAIGNIDVRGGGSYDSEVATRWRITGTDLGLETRNLSGEYGEQGKFRINFGYDELLRNRSDSYQTPFNGAGTNSLTLPANWLVPVYNGATNARGLSSDVAGSRVITGGALVTPAGAAATTAALAADLPAFHNFDVYTKRTKYDGGFSYNIDRQWEFQASARHENKDGTKLMSTVTRATGGDIATVIPDLIDQTTDQYNVSLGYTGDKAFMQAAYYGSIFKNNVQSMSWTNWATAGGATMATMSSAPSNEFHQLSLTGGYKFTPATKLVMNGSYARNTQNDAFLRDASTPLVPVSSLDGLVVTKAFNLKLTSKLDKKLNLALGYKYDNRDNQTPVNIYGFYDANEAASGAAATTANNTYNAALGLPAGTLKNNININANRPYSKKVNQLNLDADYLLAPEQWLKAGLDWQKIDRYCNGTWIDCVDANTTKENTLRAEWRGKVAEEVNAKLGYDYSKRKVDSYNENAFLALVPMANVAPGTAGTTMSPYAFMTLMGWNGWGPYAGYTATAATNAGVFFPNNNALSNTYYANQNRISELLGMRRFNMADRNRDKLRSSINWQANEQLSFQAGLNYNQDDYSNSVYGLQNAKNWALNLDGTYAVDDFSVSVFYNYEDQNSRSAGNTYSANAATASVNGATALSGGCFDTVASRSASYKIGSCLDWKMDMRDKIDTLGFAFKKKGLMSGKLDMVGELVFTRARTDIGGSGGNYVNNPYAGIAGNPTSAIAAYYIPVEAVPTVTTNTVELHLNGKYTVDKATAVRVGYTYLHMSSADYAYAGMQYGGLAGVLPTNEQAPNYTVHAVAASWIYSFK